QDQGIRHCRQRGCQDQWYRGDDRDALARVLRHDGECRYLPQGSRFSQSLQPAVRRQESGYEALTETLSPGLLTQSGATNSLVAFGGGGKPFGAGVTAPDGIDLNIHRGQFFSLLGPSRCRQS